MIDLEPIPVRFVVDFAPTDRFSLIIGAVNAALREFDALGVDFTFKLEPAPSP
ncbi:MAG: hypothetical protein H0W81_06465 [Chloroflexi bacterium]|nr:hypothetical protein [Chloroflexota bacterium]